MVDASLGGLGAVLLYRNGRQQKVSTLWYLQSLSPSESNYSTTELEALAIRWGIKKLRKYLLGAQQFKVITDHKPLQAMFNKTAGDLPPHIEKFIMDIHEYDYVVNTTQGRPTLQINFQDIHEYVPSPAAPRQRASSLGLWFKRKR